MKQEPVVGYGTVLRLTAKRELKTGSVEQELPF